jgi:hypothetical protein
MRDQEPSVETIGIDHPPVEPPAGCKDPVLWRLAREHFARHEKTDVGQCGTCPGWKTCPGTTLPRAGLATAMGLRVKESAYWTAFASIERIAQARSPRRR